MESNKINSRLRYMRLNPERARGILVDRMSTAALWNMLHEELRKAIHHTDAHERRDAFYAIVRAQAAADELFLRGDQLALFGPGESEPRTPPQRWAADPS